MLNRHHKDTYFFSVFECLGLTLSRGFSVFHTFPVGGTEGRHAVKACIREDAEQRKKWPDGSNGAGEELSIVQHGDWKCHCAFITTSSAECLIWPRTENKGC